MVWTVGDEVLTLSLEQPMLQPFCFRAWWSRRISDLEQILSSEWCTWGSFEIPFSFLPAAAVACLVRCPGVSLRFLFGEGAAHLWVLGRTPGSLASPTWAPHGTLIGSCSKSLSVISPQLLPFCQKRPVSTCLMPDFGLGSGHTAEKKTWHLGLSKFSHFHGWWRLKIYLSSRRHLFPSSIISYVLALGKKQEN